VDGETDWRVDSPDSTGNTTGLTSYQNVAKETAWQGYVP